MEWTFEDTQELIHETSVIIPDGITSIRDYAFSGLNDLTSIKIPDSVTSIGKCAFSSCFNLTSVTLSKNITSISCGVFKGCYRLPNITIPKSVTSIGEEAFAHSGLTSITIPDGVTSISKYAFNFCKNLTSVIIPASVTSIGKFAFFESDELIIELDWIEFNREVFFSENMSHLFRNLTFKTLGGDEYKIIIPPDTRREDFENVSLNLLYKEMREMGEVVDNLELCGLVVLYK